MPSHVVYPAIGFPGGTNVGLYVSEASFTIGDDIGTRLLDNAGQGWEIASIVERGRLPATGWRRWLGAKPMSLEDVAAQICAAIDQDAEWRPDEEFVVGEGGPPRDEAQLIEHFKARLRAASSIDEICRIIDDPYRDATAYCDWYKMLPEAVYPAIAFGRSGRILAYRIEALTCAPRSIVRSGDLIGMEIIDSTGRCWRIDDAKTDSVRGSRLMRLFTRPSDDTIMHEMTYAISERAPVAFAEVQARTRMSLEGDPG